MPKISQLLLSLNRSPPAMAWVCTMGLVACAFLIRLPMQPVLGGGLAYSSFYPAVIWRGGRRPARRCGGLGPGALDAAFAHGRGDGGRDPALNSGGCVVLGASQRYGQAGVEAALREREFRRATQLAGHAALHEP